LDKVGSGKSIDKSLAVRLLIEGSVYHWPVLSPDSSWVAYGKAEPGQLAQSVMVLNIVAGEETELLPDMLVLEDFYRMVTSLTWSIDGRKLIVGQTGPASPPIESLVVLDIETKNAVDLLDTTSLYNPPVSVSPDGRYFIFSQGKLDYREFMGEGDDYRGPDVPEPFYARLDLLDLDTEVVSYPEFEIGELNAYWPQWGAGNQVIYFADADIYWNAWWANKRTTVTTIYRATLNDRTVEKLFEAKNIITYTLLAH